jgi:hypothetical protein
MSQVATVILKQCETYRSSTITYPIVLYQGVERAVIEDIRGTLRPITTTITPLPTLPTPSQYREDAEVIRGLCDIYDEETLTSLTSKLEVLTGVRGLLTEVHHYLSGLGLQRLEDYVIELSTWVDIEFDDWRKPQIIVKLLNSGLRKLNEKGLDGFKLLNNILDLALKTTSREVLAEILIMVE